jgi:hypothetical protein
MHFVNRFVWIFTSPTRVFDDVREGRASWWEPWVWQSVLYAIAGVMSMPIQRAVAELNSNDLPPDQLQQQLEMMERFGWVQIVGTPPILLLLGLVLAGITYVLVSILSSRANFKQYFTVTLYASIIGAVSLLVSNLVVRMRGVESIRTVQDAQVTLGLGFLAPEGDTLLFGILSTVNVFTVWSLAVLALGLMHVFGMSRNSAIACVVPWWLISVVFSVVGTALGGAG